MVKIAIFVAATIAAAAAVLDDRAPTTAPDPTAGLSERQLAGQMIVYGYAGLRVPNRLVRYVRRGEAGGVIVFDRNIGSRANLRAQMSRLQRAARSSDVGQPLLTMVDQEGGLVKRLSGPPTRSPLDLGRTGNADLVERQGRATAANLRAVQLNVNLAPVLDVGRTGSYQLSTERAYGSSAEKVASLGTAFVRGIESRRVAATLKHFPGLGTVPANEDEIVQRVKLPLARLRSIDELPFERAIADGADMVMTSTAIYPPLDRRPAMLSQTVTKGELRNRLGFDGAIITDDLEVPALRRYGPPPRLGLQSARAGNDLLLFAQRLQNGRRGHELVVRAMRSGRLDSRQVRASARRVLELRARLSG